MTVKTTLKKSPSKIMIVEDEIIVRQDLEEYLIDLGYEIIAAIDNGPEAIQLALRHRPDLIFMDINLKGDFDGIETTEKILSEYFVPVIYLTAFSDDRTQKRVKQSSPFGYVLKPFNDRELRAGIELALQRADFEREISERNQWYSTTLRSIGDGVITTDKFGRITYINPAAEKLTGVSIEEVCGRDVHETFQFFHEYSEKAVKSPAVAALESGQTAYLAHDSVLRRGDGQFIAVDDSAALILNDQGELLGVVVVIKDTSEQRRLFKEIIEAKRMEAVGVLAGGVAHNFNNMMTGAMGNIELSLRRVEDEKIRQYLENALIACRRSADMTKQLLAFARGQFLQPKVLELNEIAVTIQQLIISLATESITTRFDLSRELLVVKLDPLHLEQSVINLCLNSLAVMNAGGKLTIKSEKVEIIENVLDYHQMPIPKGHYARIGVIDDGSGMEKETLEKIFLPFFTTKKDVNGTGLGLSTVEGFVKQSDGFITAESELGKGTVIFLYFPLLNY